MLQLKLPRVLEKSANNAIMTKFPADDGTFEYADEVRLPNVLETITHLTSLNKEQKHVYKSGPVQSPSCNLAYMDHVGIYPP